MMCLEFCRVIQKISVVSRVMVIVVRWMNSGMFLQVDCSVDVELIIRVMVFGFVVFGRVSGMKDRLWKCGVIFFLFDSRLCWILVLFGVVVGNSMVKLIQVMISLLVMCRLGMEMLNICIIRLLLQKLISMISVMQRLVLNICWLCFVGGRLLLRLSSSEMLVSGLVIGSMVSRLIRM